MKIDIANALQNEGEIYASEYIGSFDSVDFLGERYDFSEGVKANADYVWDGQGISVYGRFEAQTQVKCSRCLKPFMYEVQFAFSEYYKEQPDEGMYAYKGHAIDLTQMLEDNLVLSLPTRHLCSEDCKGLCSKCGHDLNAGDCGCADEIDESNPFYKLKNMTDDEEV